MFVKAIGTVRKIVSQNKQIQLLKVVSEEKESLTLNYLFFHSPVKIGERVIINKTATVLKLGSGGYDFVIASIDEQKPNEKEMDKGHIMKLHYTPYQFSVLSSEEEDSKYHSVFKEPKFIDGVPVIIGELHSMLPVITTVFRQEELRGNSKRKKKVVYVMTDGAALPISFSRHVKTLKELGWIDHTITIGNSFGGELETVNIFTGLIAAKHIFSADLIIVTMGPGITGTGTVFGHKGVEQGIIANAVASLKGEPVIVLRASNRDTRDRHQGISHHTINNLKYISLVKNIIPYPSFMETDRIMKELKEENHGLHQLVPVPFNQRQLIIDLKKYPYPIKTMGRTVDEDSLFFEMAASAGYWAHHFLMNK